MFEGEREIEGFDCWRKMKYFIWRGIEKESGGVGE